MKGIPPFERYWKRRRAAAATATATATASATATATATATPPSSTSISSESSRSSSNLFSGFLGFLGAAAFHVWANLDLFWSKSGATLSFLKLSWAILGTSWAYFRSPWGCRGLFETVLSLFGVTALNMFGPTWTKVRASTVS